MAGSLSQIPDDISGLFGNFDEERLKIFDGIFRFDHLG